MKTRKIAQVLTALALAATMTAPVTANAGWTDEADTHKGSFSGAEEVNAEQSQNTNVKLIADPSYLVTIPATISLTDGAAETTDDTGTPGDEIYTGKGTIKVEDLHISSNDHLKVCISDANFVLKGDGNIPYTIKVDSKDGDVVSKDSYFAEFDSTSGKEEAGTSALFFATDDVIKNAGEYSETITFKFSVVTYVDEE